MTAGLLLVDKPEGPTSHAVVARVRKLARTRRVGHAGTLDPMATGLLVLGIDRGTKLLSYAVGLDKTYHATVRLGSSTVTDDRTGEVVSAPGVPAATDDAAVDAAVAALRGPLRQVPSAVSAVKVDGRRSYDRVRAGEDVVLEARDVVVTRLDVVARRRVDVPGPDGTGTVSHLDLDVEVDCSSGTYVRALARDLGRALGTGGHLTRLRRTRTGPFDVADALDLDAFDPDGGADVREHVLALGRSAASLMPSRVLDPAECVEVTHGRFVPRTGTGGTVAGLDASGALVAVLRDRGAQARPETVVPEDERR